MKKTISEKFKKLINKSRDLIIVKGYQITCHFYSIATTLLEDILFRVNKPSLEINNRGFFKFENKNCNFEAIKKTKKQSINKYLTKRNLTENTIKNLVNELFNLETRNIITSETGFYYSIDFIFVYDRSFINYEDRNVRTLDQWYSYRWHFDKPNSNHMLKIIIPLNIENNHGPLIAIDKNSSRQIRDIRNIDIKKLKEKSTMKFTGNGNLIYCFNPNLCIHKDGIPEENLTSTQIMLQLNPWKEWSINSNLIQRDPQLNKSLKIYTEEPKFPWIAYRDDIRVPLSRINL